MSREDSKHWRSQAKSTHLTTHEAYVPLGLAPLDSSHPEATPAVDGIRPKPLKKKTQKKKKRTAGFVTGSVVYPLVNNIGWRADWRDNSDYRSRFWTVHLKAASFPYRALRILAKNERYPVHRQVRRRIGLPQRCRTHDVGKHAAPKGDQRSLSGLTA